MWIETQVPKNKVFKTQGQKTYLTLKLNTMEKREEREVI
jgi:hypothetical protein